MPAVALARTLRQRGHEPVLVTEGREVERAMLAREGSDLPAMPLPGGGSSRPSKMTLPFWLGRATLAARRMLREERFDCVVSTGGRASVPVGLAARMRGLPLYLLEQNAVTGRANRCLLPFARRIYHGLPPTSVRSGRRALVTGTPLRDDVGAVDRIAARRQLDLDPCAQIVLVLGGSQGARVLNEIVPQSLAGVVRAADAPALRVVHLSGSGRDAQVAVRYPAALQARVLPGTSSMAGYYAAADLVICRGGGTTVAELAAAGRPAVIVPYPYHRDCQQLHNGEVLVAADAAVVVEERELNAAWLGDIVTSLLADPARLVAMGQAARSVCHRDAADAIVDDIERQCDWTVPGVDA